MISVRHAGRNFQVLFEEHNARRLHRNGFEPVQTIECKILDEDMTVVAHGIAVKSNDGEAYNRELGSRLALRRAVRGLELDGQLAFTDAFRRSWGRLPGRVQTEMRKLGIRR